MLRFAQTIIRSTAVEPGCFESARARGVLLTGSRAAGTAQPSWFFVRLFLAPY
jgi:hypothetical protein